MFTLCYTSTMQSSKSYLKLTDVICCVFFNFTASRYDIFRASSILALQNDSNPDSHYKLTSDDLLQGNLTAPQDYGTREVFIIEVPVNASSVASYAFVMRAYDDAGLVSDFSNVVQATLREYIPPSGPSSEGQGGLTGGQIALVVIFSVLGIVLVIGIAGASFKYLTKPKNTKTVDVEGENTDKKKDGNANNAYVVDA